MLYPLSYEGLACTFALDTGRVSVRWARACYLAPNGLCRTCAACRMTSSLPPPRHAASILRLVVPGHSRRDGSGVACCWSLRSELRSLSQPPRCSSS
jgi:hypothetical protein